VMPRFSDRSLGRLSTCDPRLYQLFFETVKDFDCTILCGYRGPAEQERAFAEGLSYHRWPHSRHNRGTSERPCSLAVDAAPYPINWDDLQRFCLFAGWVLRTAKEFGIPIIWGADWNQNMCVGDESFLDYCHYEIRA